MKRISIGWSSGVEEDILLVSSEMSCIALDFKAFFCIPTEIFSLPLLLVDHIHLHSVIYL